MEEAPGAPGGAKGLEPICATRGGQHGTARMDFDMGSVNNSAAWDEPVNLVTFERINISGL